MSASSTYRMRYMIAALVVLGGQLALAQGVRMGRGLDPAPDGSAMLHLDNTSYSAGLVRGMLPPRVDLVRSDTPGPVGPLPLPPSLLVFNTATTALTGNDAQYNVYPGYYYWDGARWLRLRDGTGRQVYTFSTTASVNIVAQATWPTTATANITGLATPQYLRLEQGDRVFIEAAGAVGMYSAAGQQAYTDVEVQLVYTTNGAGWVADGVLASTIVSLDTRLANGSSSNWFLGLFTSTASGFQQRGSVQNWSLAADFVAPSVQPYYRFWVRARRLNSSSATMTVQTGDDFGSPVIAYDLLRGGMRVETYKY